MKQGHFQQPSIKERSMLKVILTFLLLAAVHAAAGDIILSVNGRTKHQIVVPDHFANASERTSILRAAAILQKCFRTNNVTLQIVKESARDPKMHGIFLGSTAFAEKNGLKVKKLTNWQYGVKTVKKHVIIAGNDAPNPIKAYARRPYLGTLHGVTEFLYRYAGARFLKPGKDGIVFIPNSIVAIPDDLNVKREPYFLEHEWWWNQYSDFNIANKGIQFQKIWSRWGHQHPAAIPVKKYSKTHPEYFALTGGLRQNRSTQYCFSNPAVRELIYKHILERCDEGYDIVELGQADGFVPCQCKKCFDLYGVRPKARPDDGAEWINDPAWGEKIWRMHYDMAVRLKKDRPGKKVMISAYTVTAQPPEKIRAFPDNVIIEMMKATPENFKNWESVKVPGGYAAYIYWWGSFNLPGYTPINDIATFDRQIKLFKKYNVRYVQVNGLPYQYGLEGPTVYVYLRLGIDPDHKNAAALYQEYLEAAFGNVQVPMRRFFTKLHNSTTIYQQSKDQLYKMGRDPVKMYTMMYTPDQIAAMEEDLKNAEKLAVDSGIKNRIATVRGEFDFLKNIVNVVYRWHDFNSRRNADSLNLLLDALELRDKQLKELDSKRGTPYNPTYLRHAARKTNSNWLAIPPFNWNIKEMRKSGVESLRISAMKAHRAETVPALNSPAWNKVPAERLFAEKNRNVTLKTKTSFRIMYDEENLYIRVEGTPLPGKDQRHSRGRDAEIWLKESIVFQLSPKMDRSQYYYFAYDAAPNSYADAEHGFIVDTYDPRFGWNDWTWNGVWSYQNQFVKGKWSSLAVIPLKTLKADPPKKGDIWYFNLGRVHFDGAGKRELSVWFNKMNPSRVPADAVLGELHFD